MLVALKAKPSKSGCSVSGNLLTFGPKITGKPKTVNAAVEIIYQKVENLHLACPNHTGDWYFTGNYPTPGGNKVVNRAFVNWVEKKNEIAY